MVVDNNARVKVWRENDVGEQMWAVLSDRGSKHFPVIWSRDADDATEFNGGEANTILKRYQSVKTGVVPIGETKHALEIHAH